MKNTKFYGFLFLTILFGSLISFNVNSVFSPSGPLIDEVVFISTPLLDYGNESDLLLNGSIDMMRIYSISQAETLSLEQGINLYSSPGGSLEAANIYFNCRRNPLDDVGFRTAVSMLVDREYISDTLLEGYAIPLTQFEPAVALEWSNPVATAPIFDSVQARRTLDAYNYTISEWGIRINPRTLGPIRNLEILTPLLSEDPTLWQIGYTLNYYMNASGISCTHLALDSFTLMQRTMIERDFDIAVLDTSMGQAPFGLYTLLHSSRNYPGTMAYTGINDTELDNALNKLWFGVTRSEAIQGAKDSQASLAEILPYIPVLTIPHITAVNNEWNGVTNIRGIGADNIWTYQTISNKVTSEKTFITTAPGGFNTLNPLIANTVNEWKALDLIYSPLFTLNPETLEETPILAKSWNIEPWTTPTKTQGMKTTIKIADEAKWQDGEPFTSDDIKLCIELLKETNTTSLSKPLKTIVDVKTPDNKTLEVYYNEPGYRQLYDLAWLTFTPKHIWENISNPTTFKPWQEQHPTIQDLTKLVGNGPFIYLPSDFTKNITLAWNPTYTYKNTLKTPLVERLTTLGDIKLGDKLTVKYRVKDYKGNPYTKQDNSFSVKVTRNDGTFIESIETKLSGNTYEATINTSELSLGNYLITFNALPYGTDSTTINIVSPDTTPPIITVSITPSNPTDKDQVIFQATASDTSGVKTIRIIVNSIEVKTENNSTSCSYTGGPYTGGNTVTYYAEATDQNNNTAKTESISFIVTNQQQGIPGYPVPSLILGTIITIILLKKTTTKHSNKFLHKII